MLRLYTMTLLALSTSLAVASPQAGYHYSRPTKTSPQRYPYQNTPSSYGSGGHYFPPLATVRPLPVVPNLPPLPTPRSTATLHQQAIFQSHPPLAATPAGPSRIPASAPHSNVGKIVQQYRPPSGGPSAPTSFGSRFGGPARGPGSFNPSAPPSGHGGFLFGSFAPPTNGGAHGPQAPAAQPLRIPFGKTAVVHYPGQTGPSAPSFSSGPSGPSAPTGPSGQQNAGRPLKQYAVIEIIENDIMQNSQPFLPPQPADNFRARFGIPGNDASAPTFSGGAQIASRANANVLEQQRQAPQGRGANNISLGSGGLGLVRLPNGNIHLGSGSLNYVSGQQIRDNVNEARTRSETARAGALHFGHGSLADSPISGTGTGTGTGGAQFPTSNRF